MSMKRILAGIATACVVLAGCGDDNGNGDGTGSFSATISGDLPTATVSGEAQWAENAGDFLIGMLDESGTDQAAILFGVEDSERLPTGTYDVPTVPDAGDVQMLAAIELDGTAYLCQPADGVLEITRSNSDVVEGSFNVNLLCNAGDDVLRPVNLEGSFDAEEGEVDF